MTAPAQLAKESGSRGEFVRQGNRFTGRVMADGSSDFPVQAGRYALYVSLACPWAHRSIIVRALLGLEDVIALRVVDPLRDGSGWRFTLDPDGRDPLTGVSHLSELYLASDPTYAQRVTVPMLYDTQGQVVVSNDYPQISLDLSTQWAAHHRSGAPDLYPAALRDEIDAMAEANFHTVNNGVYKAGFATSQDAYGDAFDALFARLDVLEQLLSGQRYLVGGQLTEADVRLYTTLARFDAAYHGHFKCNLRKLAEYRSLWAYARDLYAIPAFGRTTDFGQIKAHYYGTHDKINPSLIVPKGPDTAGWSESSGRESLS